MDNSNFFNLFPLNVSSKIIRKFYYCDETDPYIFAKNLSRVNNIRFSASSDIVWGEFLDTEINLEPKEIKNYEINRVEEINGEKERKLFEKTFYLNIKKLFVENGYFYKERNKFLSKNDNFILESNPNIRAYRSYEIKLYLFENRYYMAVLPFLTFLSNECVIKSKVKSSWAFNIHSGKSFMCREKENKFFITIRDRGEKEINYPENYYYNFTSEESSENDFSSEIYRLYKGDVYKEIEKAGEKLQFLSKIADMKSGVKSDDRREFFSINYQFENGESRDFKDIFKYGDSENRERKVNLLFFFESEEKFESQKYKFQQLFSNKNSIFYTTLNEMGIKNIEFVKNPESGKSLFFYNKENLSIPKKSLEFLNSLNRDENNIAIVILEKYIGDIEPLIQHFPKHIILQPVLKENIVAMKPFVIKSYTYKVASFIKEREIFKIKELNETENALFIGMDLNHDTEGRITNLAISAVTSTGDIIHLKKHNKMKLNEKADENIIESEIINAIDKFRELKKCKPENLFVYRDGLFLEDTVYIENIVKNLGINPILIEVNKNSRVMTSKESKNSLYKMEEGRYVFYPFNYLKQKGVEINIVKNGSEYSNEKIVRFSVAIAHIYHGSPYSNIKLPYPVHIADKVARTDYEWRLYIPYLK